MRYRGYLFVCFIFAGATAFGSGCPFSRTQTASTLTQPSGRTTDVGGGIHLLLPSHFHEVPSTKGRAFRVRGTNKPSFATISVQYRLTGSPSRLDIALEQILGGLKRQGNFDLLDLQLGYVSGALALSYSVKFDQLDVAHRQWGVLISTTEGLVGVLMTAPAEAFLSASLDFLDVIGSLTYTGTI